MNKILTCILVIITLVIFVLMFLIKFRSLTDLEAEPADSEFTKNGKVSKTDQKSKSTKKPKRIRVYDTGDPDSLFSKLEANITKDDVLVTGGYKLDNGNMRYSFIQAGNEEFKEEQVATIKIKNIDISPETANNLNLDYLETDENRIFDHFGVVASKEYKKIEKTFNEKGMKVLAMPSLKLQSGSKAQLYIGNENAVKHIDISVKSTILKDGTFDIALEAKQNRK